MKVQLENSFDLPGPAAAAWAVLSDVERVAACMPGARITHRVDDTHYKGTLAVKLGPANLSFRGEVEVARLDAAAQTLRLVGKGTDTTGTSGASMDLTARVEAVDEARSKLVGTSEVSMSGKVAAFGGRMAQSVADQVLKQFAGNFAAQVQALEAAPAASAGPEAAVPTGAVSEPEAPSTGPATPAIPITAPAATVPPAAPMPPPAELNALALAWGMFRDWLRALFSRRRA